MPPRVKIEEVLPTGEKITVTLEGHQVSKSRVLQILDMLSLMGGSVDDESSERGEFSSMKERVWGAIVERYGDGSWFTLKDLFSALVDEEPRLKMTTLASYLAKFVSEGRLAKKGQKPSTLYKVRSPVARTSI